MKRILIQLTDNQIIDLERKAYATGNSRSAVIRTALNEYFINHDKGQSEQVVDYDEMKETIEKLSKIPKSARGK
uniref:Putative ribbon-helix-helix protein repressor n=1 Tax=viral metagenome TaxID=1070528 RepID=A0A6H1ZI35_9ZZZZ